MPRRHPSTRCIPQGLDTARLLAECAFLREAAKQETPDRGWSEASTAHHLLQQEARAAGAQSDRGQ